MISFDEALALLLAEAKPLGAETLEIDGAHGRVLAEAVVAQVDSPPADVSAMDGYAVREADLGPPLRLIGTAYPGAAFDGAVGAGECVRIFTGGPIPSGADRVIVQEIVRREGDAVHVEGRWDGRHIRARGGDFVAGDTLVEAGRALDARALVAAAGADLGQLVVARRPRVAILGTGDELVAPGEARARPGSIPESVSIGVAALVADWGGAVVSRERLPDIEAVISAAAENAVATADVVVVTGGASVGEKDYAKSVFSGIGLDLIFSKIAIKPGKPVWFGRVGGTLVLGLPGNPTSALITARLFLAPLLAGLGAGDPTTATRWGELPLAAPLPPTGDRETFVRAIVADGAARPLSNQDSGSQRTLAAAEVVVRRLAGAPAIAAGDSVAVMRL